MAKYTIQATRDRRACTISERAVKVPNACSIGYGKPIAEPGDLINYREGLIDGTSNGRLARVLGCIDYAPTEGSGENQAPEVKNWLLVLALSDEGTHAYERWVDPVNVTECQAPPTAFASWFFQRQLPSPPIALAMAHYGTLSESYIADPTCGPKAYTLQEQCREGVA